MIFFKRNNYFAGQLMFLLLLTLGSAAVLFGPLAVVHGLYWDRPPMYSFFRDNLHALNSFGEIQWWSSKAANGFPIYYSSILAHNNSTPLFVLIGFILWLLGLVGIKMQSFYELHVLYLGILIPLLFNLGLWALARQMIKNPAAVLFVIIIGAFSPAIVFNVSDIGIETVAYGLIFSAAYMRFQNSPDRQKFITMSVALLLLPLSFSHNFLHWTILFVPLFIAVCLFLNPSGFRSTLKVMFHSVPIAYWGIAIVAAFACAVPTMITVRHGADILRTTSGTALYPYAYLSPGNLLELIGASTPGISFTAGQGHQYSWIKEQIELARKALNPHAMTHVSNTYLGIIALPLALVGIVWGMSFWRKRLFILISFCLLILILSAYSPIMSLLLVWQTPFRTANHYSDIAYRVGLSTLVILAAGMGLDVLLRATKQLGGSMRRIFFISAVLSLVLALGVFLLRIFFVFMQHAGPAKMDNVQIVNAVANGLYFKYAGINFNFMIASLLVYGIVVFWLTSARTEVKKTWAVILLLVLVFIDVSTVAFFYSRLVVQPAAEKVNDPSIRMVGSDGNISFYANNLLVLSRVKELELSGIDPNMFPELALTRTVVPLSKKIPAVPMHYPSIPFVALPDPYLTSFEFSQFKGAHPIESGMRNEKQNMNVVKQQQSYNSMTIQVHTPVESILFWRDTFSPFWKATVNGRRAVIAPAFNTFKAVVVPAGDTRVTFQYSPGILPILFLIAYLIFFTGAVLMLVSRISKKQESQAI